MISSVKNSKVQSIRNLQRSSKKRREQNEFVVEGVRLVEEAFESGLIASQIFFEGNLSERGTSLIEEFESKGAQVYQLSSHVMRAISETKSPQGILAVIERRNIPIPESVDFLLILDQLRDPGNLGTILRSAASADVDAVLLSAGNVDPFAPKVLRAGMGAHFRIAIQSCSWKEIIAHVERSELHVFGASSVTGIPYYRADLSEPIALVIGGESEGISETAQNKVDSFVHIPMPGGGDSLNAAVASGILLFEAVRQREIDS